MNITTKLSKEQQRQQQVLAILVDLYGGSQSALHYRSIFQLLIAVILSAQTNDNQVNQITAQLFRHFPDAAAFAALEPAELEPHINSCGLYKNKAKNIIATARLLMQEYNGEVPNTKELLLKLPGVGGKTANVVLSEGFQIPALAVDTHVFRVANRLGLVKGKTPDQVEEQLCALIPRNQWAEAHHWLIWHGRKICNAQKPTCAECPLADLCPKNDY